MIILIMYENIDDIIEKYVNGKINIYYQFDDIIKITNDDKKKYNIKPFYDWNNKPVNPLINYDNDLVEFTKRNNLSTLFLLDVRNFLIRGFSWQQAIIYYFNNRKPIHPKIRQLLLIKKRGYIKEN